MSYAAGHFRFISKHVPCVTRVIRIKWISLNVRIVHQIFLLIHVECFLFQNNGFYRDIYDILFICTVQFTFYTVHLYKSSKCFCLVVQFSSRSIYRKRINSFLGIRPQNIKLQVLGYDFLFWNSRISREYKVISISICTEGYILMDQEYSIYIKV